MCLGWWLKIKSFRRRLDSIGDQREIGPEIQEVLETGDRYNNQRYKIIFKFQIRKVLVVLRFST